MREETVMLLTGSLQGNCGWTLRAVGQVGSAASGWVHPLEPPDPKRLHKTDTREYPNYQEPLMDYWERCTDLTVKNRSAYFSCRILKLFELFLTNTEKSRTGT